ncbi:MAG: nucleotidyltransferase domain-containing protein [Alphaproteobacteria bacterium]|nr:nucleotidyltransferase domain-containing protein [Alphaproteobacteria bacterium]
MDTSNRPQIEKTMTLAEHEFITGCQRLAADGDSVTTRVAQIALDAGSVTIRYEPLAGVRLGGLLELPRAKVSLAFSDVTEAEQEAFVRRFDITFQRGGG